MSSWRSDFGVIRVFPEENRKVVVVDTKQAKYKGRPWNELDRTERRKLENLVFLSEPTEKIKVIYDTPQGLVYNLNNIQ